MTSQTTALETPALLVGIEPVATSVARTTDDRRDVMPFTRQDWQQAAQQARDAADQHERDGYRGDAANARILARTYDHHAINAPSAEQDD